VKTFFVVKRFLEGLKVRCTGIIVCWKENDK